MKISNKYKKIIILVAIFTSMLVLNLITPLIMDDFNYSFGLNGRIKNFKEIIDFQIVHYLSWGGRSVAHTLLQLFLMNNKMLFNISNAMVYTLLIYLIYSIIKKENEEKPLYLLLIHFSLWFFTPAFGQAFIWLTGSCNYLWTTTIIILFLKLFIDFDNNNNKHNLIKIILYGLLGVIAGWTNENSGAGLISILIAYTIHKKFFCKEKLNKIQIAGAIGSLLGFIIMIMAPGNYKRASGFKDNTFFIIKYLKRFLNITQNATVYLFVLLIILIVLITIYIYKKQKIDNKIYIYFTGAFIAAYSMLLSPDFPPRSWTIVIIFLTISIGKALYDLQTKNNLKDYVIIDIILFTLLIFCNSYINVSREEYSFFKEWNNRIEIINSNKEKEKTDFEFIPIYTTRKQTPSFALADLYDTNDDLNNKRVARYFGIKSIKAKK